MLADGSCDSGVFRLVLELESLSFLEKASAVYYLLTPAIELNGSFVTRASFSRFLYKFKSLTFLKKAMAATRLQSSFIDVSFVPWFFTSSRVLSFLKKVTYDEPL